MLVGSLVVLPMSRVLPAVFGLVVGTAFFCCGYSFWLFRQLQRANTAAKP
jgi:hypothetical protein